MLEEEENFSIKNFSTYKNLEKVYEIRKNVLENIKKLKENKKLL